MSKHIITSLYYRYPDLFSLLFNKRHKIIFTKAISIEIKINLISFTFFYNTFASAKTFSEIATLSCYFLKQTFYVSAKVAPRRKSNKPVHKVHTNLSFTTRRTLNSKIRALDHVITDVLRMRG